MKIFLKFLLIIVIFLAIGAGVIYHYRFDIFQYSAEEIIKKNLPSYVLVDRIIFDLPNNKLEVKNFRIKNPAGYENKFLATIENITAKYKQRGKNILDGIEVTEITASAPAIYIERLKDGRVNLNDMAGVMAAAEREAAKKAPPKAVSAAAAAAKKQAGDKNISDYLTLPGSIGLVSGRIVFLDKAVMARPYTLSFDRANGNIGLVLSDDYSQVRFVSSEGNGIINSDTSQRLNWKLTFDPTRQRITMSSRFEPDNVDMLILRPYYDRYSPIDVRSGRVSGTLIYDFENGNIGANNVLVFRGLRFEVKQGASGADYWGSMVPDMIRYLSSSPDEITFDFTIKGDINSPRFALGQRTSQAITQGVVSDTMKAMMQKGQGGSAQGGGDSSQVINLIEGLLKK